MVSTSFTYTNNWHQNNIQILQFQMRKKNHIWILEFPIQFEYNITAPVLAHMHFIKSPIYTNVHVIEIVSPILTKKRTNLTTKIEKKMNENWNQYI